MNLDEKEFGKTIRQHVREFGQVLTLVAILVAYYFAFKLSDTMSAVLILSAGLLCHEVAYYFPQIVYPAWKLWMKLAHVLGAIMTTIILGIAWFLILVPIAMLLKCLGKKVMQLSLDKNAKTYWNDRDAKYYDFKRMENQF
jgi:hypothetical protein